MNSTLAQGQRSLRGSRVLPHWTARLCSRRSCVRHCGVHAGFRAGSSLVAATDRACRRFADWRDGSTSRLGLRQLDRLSNICRFSVNHLLRRVLSRGGYFGHRRLGARLCWTTLFGAVGPAEARVEVSIVGSLRPSSRRNLARASWPSLTLCWSRFRILFGSSALRRCLWCF